MATLNVCLVGFRFALAVWLVLAGWLVGLLAACFGWLAACSGRWDC